nr:hypothetical protein [uncultured Pseudodesulfovibrio sp.]
MDHTTTSPALEVKLLDDTGKKLSRRTSYGGRNYDTAMLSKLSFLAATAAVSSPTPSRAKPKAERVYQLLLPCSTEDTIKLNVSLLTDVPPLNNSAESLQKPTIRAGSGSIKTDGLFLLKSFAPFTYAETVKSFPQKHRPGPSHELSTQLPATQSSSSTLPAPQPKTASHFDKSYKQLKRYGIVPYWELLTFGWTVEDVAKKLAKQTLNSYTDNSLVASACTGNICDYRLKNKPKKSKEVGFLFMDERLYAMTVDISTKSMVERRSLVQALATLYGGTVWSRSRGPEMGNDVSRLEYMAETSGFSLKTTGNKLRIFAADTNNYN